MSPKRLRNSLHTSARRPFPMASRTLWSLSPSLCIQTQTWNVAFGRNTSCESWLCEKKCNHRCCEESREAGRGGVTTGRGGRPRSILLKSVNGSAFRCVALSSHLQPAIEPTLYKHWVIASLLSNHCNIVAHWLISICGIYTSCRSAFEANICLYSLFSRI